MKERINWVDTLKFLGMFYIYIGHLGPAAGKLYLFVFAFHVPLFFFISGLSCGRVKTSGDFFLNSYRRFKTIIIPYFVFSLIGIAFICIKYNYTTLQLKSDLWQMTLGIRNQIPLGTLWFLPCLFIVTLYHSIIELFVKNRVVIFAITFLVYVNAALWWDYTPSLFFNIDSALYYLPYYSFGAMLSLEKVNSWILSKDIKVKLINFIVLIASLFATAYVYFYGMPNPFGNIKYTQFLHAFYFLLTIVMFVPSIAFAKNINFGSLILLGRNSILLCGTEQVLKLSILSVMSIFGFTYSIKDPMDAVLFTCICFFVSYFTLLKIYNHLKFKQ